MFGQALGDSGTQRRNSASNKMRPFGCHNNHAGYEAEPQAKPQAIGRGDGDGEGDGEEEIPASDIELANGQTLPTRWKNGRLQLMIPREMRTLSEIPLANGICIRVRRKPAAPPPPPHTPSGQAAPTHPGSSAAHRNSTVMVSHKTPVAMNRAQALPSGDARSDIITVLKIEPATLNDLIFSPNNSHSGGAGEGEGEGEGDRGRTLLKMEAIAESELLQMSHRLGSAWRTLNSPVLSLLAPDLRLLGGTSSSPSHAQPSPSGSSAASFSHWINACADELGQFLVTQDYLVTHGRLSCRQDAISHAYTATLGPVLVMSSLAASGLSQPRSALTCETFHRLLYVSKYVLSLSRDKRALMKRRMESLKRRNLVDRLTEEMDAVMECAKELANWIRKPENDALFEGLDLAVGVRVSDNFDEVSVWRGGIEGDGTDLMMSQSQTSKLEMDTGDAGWRVVWTCSKFTSQFPGGGFFSDPSLVRETEEEMDKDGVSSLLQSASEDGDLQVPPEALFSSGGSEERDGGRGASEVQGGERTPKRLRAFPVQPALPLPDPLYGSLWTSRRRNVLTALQDTEIPPGFLPGLPLPKGRRHLHGLQNGRREGPLGGEGGDGHAV
uniref:Uncharacterized protein n=1 Tax=Chromera velia CCMP2878 TaxID=1169474 RepID=A0A0K6SAR8_9ALVE|eukprot:Cvel_11469.t1-p1 / transcript=Cvel_11469.t1 / gene=Cvel_11469 / organism=Chromera_velia_CCMP2878 / gene_product=hypothetical protein / transcript_product=hypothetical protein / location=Cvel_scaffold722:14479-18791(-) / protein_length=610 / sequence_SO=supercontig / SO=protein_coding / is_pseudo=false